MAYDRQCPKCSWSLMACDMKCPGCGYDSSWLACDVPDINDASHIARVKQQAITAYLAEVPLPEGWTEEAFDMGDRIWPVVRYIEKVEGLSDTERVTVAISGIYVVSVPAHWPAIPLPVLIRAAVQCHRLREAGR